MTTPTTPIVPDPNAPQTPAPVPLEDQMRQFMDFTSRQFAELASNQQALQRDLATMRNSPPTPPPPPQVFDKDAFFSDPDRVITSRIAAMKEELQKDMAAQLAPVNNLAATFAAQNRAASLLQYILSNPGTADAAQFQDIITQLLMNMRGEVDQNTLYNVYLTAKGMHYSRPNRGQLAPPQVPVSTPPTPPATPLPPYVSPNTPITPPSQQGLPALRQLNELEARLCRERNMSAADFLYYGGEISEEIWRAHTTPPAKG